MIYSSFQTQPYLVLIVFHYITLGRHCIVYFFFKTSKVWSNSATSKSAGVIFPSSRCSHVCLCRPLCCFVIDWGGEGKKTVQRRSRKAGVWYLGGRYTSYATTWISAPFFPGRKSSSHRRVWGGVVSACSQPLWGCSRMGKLQLLILVHTAQLLVKNIVAHCQHCMQTIESFFFFFLLLPWVWGTGVFDMAVPMSSNIHSCRNWSCLAHSFLGSPYLVGIAIFQMLSWLSSCGDQWPGICEWHELHPYKINLIKSFCVLTASPTVCSLPLSLFLRCPFP